VKGVLVFGTICIDRVKRVRAFPSPGDYQPVLSEELMLGGEAANTAFALRSWGIEAELFGNPIGRGELSEELRRLLSEHGLCGPGVAKGSNRTPVCDIYVTPDGARTMFGLGFEEMGEGSEIPPLPLRAGEWFTSDPNLGSLARRVVRQATAAGMRMYLMDFVQEHDPIPKGAIWQSSTDWVGKRGDLEGNRAWLAEWAGRHEMTAILTDGADGFLVATGTGEPRHYPPFPSPSVRDTTGAGDMFRSGILFGLVQEWPFADCLRFASAAAALKCQGLGALGYVPKVREIQGWVERCPEIARQYEAG
jgi:sugar/nucleoside kinase (ribokinase family)